MAAYGEPRLRRAFLLRRLADLNPVRTIRHLAIFSSTFFLDVLDYISFFPRPAPNFVLVPESIFLGLYRCIILEYRIFFTYSIKKPHIYMRFIKTMAVKVGAKNNR